MVPLPEPLAVKPTGAPASEPMELLPEDTLFVQFGIPRAHNDYPSPGWSFHNIEVRAVEA